MNQLFLKIFSIINISSSRGSEIAWPLNFDDYINRLYAATITTHLIRHPANINPFLKIYSLINISSSRESEIAFALNFDDYVHMYIT